MIETNSIYGCILFIRIDEKMKLLSKTYQNKSIVKHII